MTRKILERLTGETSFVRHKQVLTHISGYSHKTIDQVMVCFHPRPYSYTGEDLAEISCHGNPLIVSEIMESIRATGLACLAQRGEFTMRAFLNGKINLIQAEAVGALIGSRSFTGLDMAMDAMKGKLSTEIERVRDRIKNLLIDIEASFISDSNISDISVASRIKGILKDVDAYLASSDTGRAMYDGVVTTIAGFPNAGKSSLFNAIVGYPRAIVHEDAGTTRDLINEHVIIKGLDFIFYDTAGIKEIAHGPEQIGIEKTIEALNKSNLILYVVDAVKGVSDNELKWLKLGKKTILVINKTDLTRCTIPDIKEIDVVDVSAKYKKGIDKLLDVMTDILPDNRPQIFMQRHIYLIKKAKQALNSSITAMEKGMTLDAITIDIKEALSTFNELLGDEINPNIMETVFSKFCVGK